MFSSPSGANLSQHTVYHTGNLVEATDLSEQMSICIHLKSAAMEHLSEESNALFYRHPSERNYMTFEDVHTSFAAKQNDVIVLIRYFESFGLNIADTNLNNRTIKLNGVVEQFQKAFGTVFHNYTNAEGHLYRMHQAEPDLPCELHSYISYVEGLHNMPPVRSKANSETTSNAKQNTFLGYTPLEIAEAYDFPEGDGEGETIGIIELGGTYIESDMTQFFADLGMSAPHINKVGVDANDIIQNDLEVTLDIQVIGALLPKATMVLYYGKTLITAIKEAIYDSAHRPSVLSISWAGSEYNYSVAEINEMSQLCYQASLMGITIVAASGDQGAYNSKNFLNVNVPASMPFVLGCGGTKIDIENGVNKNEVVWNELATQRGATGGGFSGRFPIPSYQENALAHYHIFQAKSAGVPDVAANADASSGYKTLYKGSYFAEGGTSAATPVWASLLIRINQNLGYRLGFINEILYKQAGSGMFRQIVEGDNGYYPAAPYWNPCTGLGSPKGKVLLANFKS